MKKHIAVVYILNVMKAIIKRIKLELLEGAKNSALVLRN